MTRTAAKKTPAPKPARKPSSPSAAPRRREWRLLLPLTAIVEGVRRDGTTFREKAKLENISSGGAFFRLASDIAVGCPFELLIDLPKPATEGQPIRLRIAGKAVRLERAAKSKKAGVAVRFGKGFTFVVGSK
jgi:hypothetical protein